MRIFVTYSASFVRTALVERLAQQHNVRLQDVADPAATPWSDPNRIARQMQGSECVIHFSRPVPERNAPELEKWNLVAGTENLLNASLAVGVRRFVLISTADVSLHRAERVNWNEQREPPREEVVGLGARLARVADEIVLGFNLRGLETIALRPAWVWGPGMPDPRSRAEQDQRRGLRLVGKGTNFVATTHIDNLLSATSRAIEATDEGVGHAYYVCDNEMLDAATFFESISRALGLPAPSAGPGSRAAYIRAALEEFRRGPDLWRSDVLRRGYPSVFDTLSAHKSLGWSPEVNFEQGLASMTPELKLVQTPT